MGTLRVGAGRALMNPQEWLYPIPHFGDVSFGGLLQDLYARVIVIDQDGEKFVLITTDSGDEREDELWQQLADEFSLEKDHILALSIHNHSAPGWDGHGMMGVDREQMRVKGLAFREVVITAIRKALADALASLRPARYGFAEGDSYINVNRDMQDEDGNWVQGQNFRGFSDKTLATIRFEELDGTPIAFFLNYGCHATTAFCVKDVDGYEKVTPGFNGIACEFIERRYDNKVVCMWSSGAAGDQNPIFCSEATPRIYETDGYSELTATPPGTQYLIQKFHGHTHAFDALHILEHMTCSGEEMPITIRQTFVDIEKQKFPEGTDRFLVWVMANNAYWKHRPEMIVNGRPPKKEYPVMEPDGTFPMELKLWQLGDIALVGVGGEIYSEIGWKMKKASPMANTIVLTHCGLSGGGYTLSDASKDHNVFQYFGMVRPGDIDGRLERGVRQLFEADPEKEE